MCWHTPEKVLLAVYQLELKLKLSNLKTYIWSHLFWRGVMASPMEQAWRWAKWMPRWLVVVKAVQSSSCHGGTAQVSCTASNSKETIMMFVFAVITNALNFAYWYMWISVTCSQSPSLFKFFSQKLYPWWLQNAVRAYNSNLFFPFLLWFYTLLFCIQIHRCGGTCFGILLTEVCQHRFDKCALFYCWG